jgi:hypothetical protein
MRGTFFVVGEVAEAQPTSCGGLEAATIVARLASRAAHRPRSSQPRDDVAESVPEDLTGHPVTGLRRCSRSCRSRAAVDILADAGFTYLSSVLLRPQSAVGDAAPAAVPLAQRPGRAAVSRAHGRVRSRISAAYLRASRAVSTAAAGRSPPDALDLLSPVRLRPRRAAWWCLKPGSSGAGCSGTTADARSPRSTRRRAGPPLVERVATPGSLPRLEVATS